MAGYKISIFPENLQHFDINKHVSDQFILIKQTLIGQIFDKEHMVSV